MKNALIIMTRVPIPGKTKTRLEGYFTREQCVMLHIAFLKDIYDKCRTTGADVFVFYTPQKHEGRMINILGSEERLLPQEGMDLGERMSNAISSCLSFGYEKCILIGSDIPAIEPDEIKKAFTLLDSRDIVITPTYDGGYCLIGMKQPYPGVFGDNFYGTGAVYDRTLSNIRSMRLTVEELDKCLDIDVREDVELLIRGIEAGRYCGCPNTIEFLGRLKLLGAETEQGDGAGRTTIL